MSIKDKLSPEGEDWEITNYIEVIKDKRRENNDVRRFRIAFFVLSGIAAGAVVLGMYGAYLGNFDAVGGFWKAVGPIFGAIIGYYFGKSGDTS